MSDSDCPKCGKEIFVYDYDFRKDYVEDECEHCGEKVTIYAEYSVDYTIYTGWREAKAREARKQEAIKKLEST